MSKTVRTYSFDEICEIIRKHAHQEYLDGKIALVSKDGMVQTSGTMRTFSSDMKTLQFTIRDDNA